VSAVELRGAEARVAGATIWHDVTVTVERGRFVAVLGPNGAGKSTLIRAVLGLQPLSAGTAAVLGRRPGEANERIGYLPQRRSFDETTRIRGVDLVRLGLDGARWGLPLPGRRGRDASRRVAETIGLVGASAYAERPIGELSGGEQQRLLIAQALVRRPQLLLLAHDVNPIIGYLDGVIYFAGGTAVEGAPEEVVSTETLTQLYGVPVEVLHASDGRLVVVGAPDLHGHHAH
jgi:zinc/manganese transport system ATP-binding protein